MAVDREEVFQRLFRRLAAVPGIRTSSRKFRSLDQVGPSECPALFLVKGAETPTQRRGLPPKWALGATAFIYVSNQEPEGPSAELNRLLQDLEAALEMTTEELQQLERDPNISNAQYLEIKANSYGTTLGGICSHAWIAGTIETDEGVLGNQAAAAIPIEVLTL